MANSRSIKVIWQDRLFNGANTILMVLILLVIAYPLYFVIVASFTKPEVVQNSVLLLYPKELFLKGYKKTLSYAPLWRGYFNSIVYTICKTLFSVFATAITAYPLSVQKLPGRKGIMFLFVFTMFFSGGLIPSYLLVRSLGLYDSMWTLIFPGLLSVYNIIVCRSFFESIPRELSEAAEVDGCSYFRYFFSILLPLSKAVLAVLALFYGSAIWNDYFSSLIYLSSEEKMPLQVVLRNLLLLGQVNGMSRAIDPKSLAEQQQTSEQMKYCVIIASTLPLLLAYPFLQKHFAKGVLLGSVKG